MKVWNKFIASVGLLGLALAGCDRGKNSSAKQEGGQPSPAPAVAGGASDAAKPIVKVGIPYPTRDQYKPVVGKFGGRLVRDAFGEPKSFNPIVSGETSTSDYTMRMFEGLTDQDPWTGEVIPLLAEKWETTEDGLTWTFHLRKDVTFNDGTPFTAEDVVFTWNELIFDNTRPADAKEPRWPCPMRDIGTFEGKPVKVEKIDDYTVRFTTPVKVAIWDEIVGDPCICSAKKYRPLVQDGSFGGSMSADAKPEDIVGTGPFMLGQYVRGEKIILKRNPHFWKKDAAGKNLPYLDELVFVVVRDLNAMLLNFQQKITDIYALKSGKDVGELRPNQEKDNFVLYQLGPAYGGEFVVFNENLDSAKAGKLPEYKVNWFRDQRFRQAVSYAIDRGPLVRNIARNLGYPMGASYTMNPGRFYYPEFGPYPYDPAKSKALLAEMGFKPGPDGILVDPQGHRLSFTVNTNSGNTIREETANFVTSDLKKIGMEVNTLYLEFNLLVDKIHVSYDWECMVFGLTGSRDPQWGANVWKSSGRHHMFWPEQKVPGSAWEKRIDEIYAAGVQELDKKKRTEIYREFVKIEWEQQPYIYTMVPERVAAVRKRFGNLFPSPAPGRNPVFHNEEEVFILDNAR